MKIYRNFKCSATNAKYERLADRDATVVKCLCGSDAFKQLSAPKFKGNSCGRNASWR